MRDRNRQADENSTFATVKTDANGTSSPTGTLGQASKQDLLLYMGDMLAELEAIAVNAHIEGLADLLGYAYRETERNQKL
jgi:hypothetical protein